MRCRARVAPRNGVSAGFGPPSVAVDSVEPVQCDPIQDLNSLSAEPDHSGLLERLQDPAHDFAARPQLVGEHLMRRGVGFPLKKQARRQPLVDSAESHVVNEEIGRASCRERV